MRMLMAALLAVFGIIFSTPATAEGKLEHGQMAGWFDALNQVGFIRACEQLNNSPDDGRSWIGVKGLTHFFDVVVPGNAELSAKFQRESPAGRRRAIATHNPVEMCIAWSMYQSINKFWAEGREAFMYAPDSLNYRPYVFPLISMNAIIANAKADARERLREEYQRALDDLQAQLNRIFGDVGADNVDGVIQNYKNVVEDNTALSALVDSVAGMLDVSGRESIRGAIDALFNQITDLQSQVNELEQYYNIPPFFFWLGLLILVLLLLALIRYGWYRIERDRTDYENKEASRKRTAEEARVKAVKDAEAERDRVHADALAVKDRNHNESIRELQRERDSCLQWLTRVAELLQVKTWEAILERIQSLLNRAVGEYVSLDGTGLRYVGEPTLLVARVDQKNDGTIVRWLKTPDSEDGVVVREAQCIKFLRSDRAVEVRERYGIELDPAESVQEAA